MKPTTPETLASTATHTATQTAAHAADGLATTRREGKFIWYQLADARALQLMQTLYQLFCQTGETT